MIENVHLVEITAYSDVDAYTIFETMNDRGLLLTLTFERLMAESLSRHDAVLAIASVVLEHLWEAMRHGSPHRDARDRYLRRVAALAALPV